MCLQLTTPGWRKPVEISGERWRGQSHCQPPKSDCFVLVTSISKPRPAPKKLPLWQSANVNWEGSLIFIFHSICNLRCLRQLLLYSYGNSHSPAKLLQKRLLLLIFWGCLLSFYIFLFLSEINFYFDFSWSIEDILYLPMILSSILIY